MHARQPSPQRLKAGEGLRSFIALLLGFISALTGLLSTLPSAWGIWLLSRPGVVIAEHPWLPVGTGIAAVALGRRGNRRFGAWLGLLGVVLGIRPFWRVQGVSRQHEAAMRAGLGADFGIQRQFQTRRARLDPLGVALQYNPPIIEQRDVPFFEYADAVGQGTLYMDIYRPAITTEARRPAIIAVHGGGWDGGDKEGFHRVRQQRLARLGYVVFDVQYRLSPAYVWPTHLIDVKTAIRWVRAHADQYHIDPERLGLVGRSAGGHIGLMAAFTPRDPNFPPPPGLPERDDVQAVVAVYPATDIALLQETVVGTLAYWVGGSLSEAPERYYAASPLFAAHPNVPPVLMAHGGRDSLVVAEHSARLHKRLCELGVPNVYLHYPWGRHGLDVATHGLGDHMLQYDTERFLAWALRIGN